MIGSAKFEGKCLYPKFKRKTNCSFEVMSKNMIFVPHFVLTFLCKLRLTVKKTVIESKRSMRFKSRSGQIGHNVANRCYTFSKGLCYVHAQEHGDGPCKLVTRLFVLQRIYIMKD